MTFCGIRSESQNLDAFMQDSSGIHRRMNKRELLLAVSEAADFGRSEHVRGRIMRLADNAV